jgi:hypothetical protein
MLNISGISEGTIDTPNTSSSNAAKFLMDNLDPDIEVSLQDAQDRIGDSMVTM